MKIIFMGTPDFAVSSLRALLQNNFKVVTVITQPDRPGGRGKKMRPSSVKTAALDAGIPVYQPEKIRDPGVVKVIKDLHADIIVVAAFGQILPSEILNIPQYGCINVHASLLPAYRGAAPIHRAVLNGEVETGVTIMQMDIGLDTGDMHMKEKVLIEPDDTVGVVHDKLANLGGSILVKTLEQIKDNQVNPVPQDDNQSSYAPMLTWADEIIDWEQDAQAIKNQVRGLNPWPGARTFLGDKLLKIWQVEVVDNYSFDVANPGLILEAGDDRGIIVQTGNGALSINELQLQGKKRMNVSQFLRGTPLTTGIVLEKGLESGVKPSE